MKKLATLVLALLSASAFGQGWVGLSGSNSLIGVNSSLSSSPILVGIGTTTPTDVLHIKLSTPYPDQEFVRIEGLDHNWGEFLVIDDDGRLHKFNNVGDKPGQPGYSDLQTRVDELSAEIASLKYERGLQQASAPAGTYTLTQNQPNPFEDRTQISYTISAKYSSAFIAFHEESGREISRQQISGGNAGEVTFATNAQPGVIFYSLVVDVQVKCTKKMVKK